MSLEANNISISAPEYFHREYRNDLPQEETGNYYIDQCKRISLVALPFLSLYKPLSFPFSLILGGLRSVTSLSQFLHGIQHGGLKENSYAFLQAALSVIALAGTILAHPLGMLITTVHDCALETFSIGKNLYDGDFQSALSSSANLVNNTLYLALLVHGGLEIAIASLAMQIFIGLSHSVTEYQKGNYLEAGGHLLMGMIRGNQMIAQVQTLQMKWKIESTIKRGAEEAKTRINQNSQESEVIAVEKYTQKFNGVVVHALAVEQAIWNGVWAHVAYYTNNLAIVTFQGGMQCMYDNNNGTLIATTGLWTWEFINGIQYAKHFYDGSILVYSTDWSQSIVFV